MTRPVGALGPGALYRTCDPARLGFRTTAELEELDEVLGQDRALSAIDFAIRIESSGYNLFVLGPPGTDRHAVVRRFLDRRASERPAPDDWCYVHGFDDERRPRMLRLPAGRGAALCDDMEQLVEETRAALATALESEEYQARRQTIEQRFGQRQATALDALQQQAHQWGLRLVQGPAGVSFAPVGDDGELVSPQDLPAARREQVEKHLEALQAELQKALRQLPRWQRERHEALRELDREMARFTVGPLIEDLRSRHPDQAAVASYLEAVEKDIVEHALSFVAGPDGAAAGPVEGMPVASAGAPVDREPPFLRRYRVNVVVDNGETGGAPVVREDHPTHANLSGRVEHVAQLGALVTDFNLIRAGALHRANGGYLVLDALEVLRQPYAWEGLKRALRARELRIESIGEAMSLVNTVSVEPEPIPLEVKVVLIGSRRVYYTLAAMDPDFAELFKVVADFGDRIERNGESEHKLARLVARLVREEDLRPFDADAVARCIEQAARRAADAERLSLEVRRMRDLLREADHWASADGAEQVERAHVDRALEHREYRSDRARQRIQDEMRRGTLEIATEGSATGQINGLSVVQLGDFAFGRPTRISARVRLGRGDVVDIEREVDLSGPLHAKGVLILAGFLGERYAAEVPLSLSASLVFEQSYGGVDGDSASSAELYALLSAIAGVPLRQSLAVTGAVNQHGGVQAIGGVNEKIEGFFDLCRARGLTGDQGVLIPASNAAHLMLRPDVVEAVAKGRFAVHAVDTVDRGIEILTGVDAGQRRDDGSYPEGSVNGLVQRRLRELARARQAFTRQNSPGTARADGGA